MKHRCLKIAVVVGVLLLMPMANAWAAEMGEGPAFIPPIWAMLPFIGILLSIALFPLFVPHFWEHHYGKVSAAWLVLGLVLMYISVPADMAFLAAYGPRMFATGEEYISFIILLGSLFVTSGGIFVSGDLRGTPTVNAVILAIGAPLASIIGTTGAAMVLIRPLLRANAHRVYQAHVVIFFIFLVANIGGSLTPIGDPPLFLGFLQGVPFFWTLHLIPHWLFMIALVLGGFFIMDTWLAKREMNSDNAPTAPERTGEPLRVHGKINFVLLLGIVASVIMSGFWHIEPVIHVGSIGEVHLQNVLRDLIMVGLAVVSMFVTSREVREANHFNFEPIKEVAYLFIGIFTTMIPALMLLNARGDELGLDEPWKFFWITGILSSFLDNAPTYLTFLATAMGQYGIENAVGMTQALEPSLTLIAISVGAVFMGANTYIGNAPNFMVKAIAEGQGVRMPTFLGYMVYSTLILFPMFVLVTLIFF